MSDILWFNLIIIDYEEYTWQQQLKSQTGYMEKPQLAIGIES